MIEAKVSLRESERLAALERYAVLDTPPEAAFDDLARLASVICGTPMALVSLVDASRQWFKARVGLSVEQTPREIAFCSHAILQDDVFVIGDSLHDARFADNPLVQGHPQIRFYAGAPLTTSDGLNLGTLCVLDQRPRVIGEEQVQMLKVLAHQVVVQLELRRHIADRERAEERLRASEEQLQRVIEGSNDGFWDWDLATGRVQISQRLEEMLGYDPGELTPHFNVRELLFHPDDLPIANAELQAHLEGRSPQYEAEFRLRMKDGRWKWILGRAKLVARDADGRPLRMAGTHTDISRRKNVERQLDRFFELSLELFCIAGLDGYFKRINPAFVQLFGYTREELVARPFVEFVHPDDREATIAEVGKLREGLQTIRFENRYICADGTARWIAWTASPVPEEGLIYAAARDVTAAKMAEETLRQSEARTRAIIDNSLGALITTDEQGIIESINPAAERIFGYATGELVGVSVAELVGEDFPSAADALQYLRDNALGRVNEIHGRRRNGEVFPAELSLFEFFLGGRRHYAGHIMDVSERHEVDRMKKDFVATVSHELRTPLTSIRGSLGLLASGVLGELTPDARQMVAVAERNSIRLISLINDILDFEKLESGKMEMLHRPTPVMRVLEKSIESVSAMAAQEEVRLELHCASALLLGDEARLTQVTVNLLSNAIKYSPRGGMVVVTATAEDGWIDVQVRDEGPGISGIEQVKLFHRFQQIDSSDTRAKGGTGLGLAICKAIVEQHGGTIGVESAEGEGSTFWFRVRAVMEAGSAEEKPLVLVLHDDPAVAGTLLRGLGGGSAAVVQSRSVDDALRLLAMQPPRLAVVDTALADGRLGELLRVRQVPFVVLGDNVVLSPAQLARNMVLVLDRANGERLAENVRQILADGNRRHGGDVLLVEDDSLLLEVLATQIRTSGASVRTARSGRAALAAVAERMPRLIILDVALPELDGYDVVAALQRHPEHRNVPLLVYSGMDLTSADRGRLQLGPTRFLMKSRSTDDEFLALVGQLLDYSAAAS